jgi:hypothetical protein
MQPAGICALRRRQFGARIAANAIAQLGSPSRSRSWRTSGQKPYRSNSAASDGELDRLEIKIREVAVDGGFKPGPTNTALADPHPNTVFIAGRQEPTSKRTIRRLRRYRTAEEGRISHLKRRYGLDRSRLKGDQGRPI